ncbi:MAG: hypothetical protein CVV44_08260 [Spirochaetae bacterium HGW-Spirochaetae-1]|jgi:hypothetical protein|nr:MAG: hypothetical protein CVV44_08260 [Spirochaetae bacterium HGW-Spirochaetae-1]
MDMFNKFIEIFDALEKEGVEYILIGGFAVVLYGLPRVTQDIDIFLKPSYDNIEKLKKVLSSLFDDDSIEEISADMLENYPVVRYGSPDGFNIDIIIRIGDMFKYSDIRFNIKNIEGHTVKIATVESLYRMKKDTVRPVDKSDAAFLMGLLKEEEKNNAGL